MKPSYKIVAVNADNIDDVGLYCSRSKSKEMGYQKKLAWIKERFNEGLEYRVLLVDEGRKDMAYRGMIEFMPRTKCWRGIDAPNYMVIHCIWVIGRHKKQGYGTKLLHECIDSAKEKKMDGVAVMTITKGGWSPKKDLFIKNGFEKVDELPPNFELHALKFSESAPNPQFFPIAPDRAESYSDGFTVLTSYQCPYMVQTIKNVRALAEEMGVNFHVQEIRDCTEAQQNGFNPYGTFHILLNGKYVTHLPGGMRDIKKALEEISG
ncbi:MAG: GNAT family N-acetyltransferase [Candidatus Bathyarchaeota archaeon]|jgi:GNAT superfamily N-acetyltransferase